MTKIYFVTTASEGVIHGYEFSQESAVQECKNLKREPGTREVWEVEDSDELTNEFAERGTSRAASVALLAKIKAAGRLVLHNA